MTRFADTLPLIRRALPVLILAGLGLAAAPAAAQDDAIDCRNARNPTVEAICGSALLTELQNQAASEYQTLAARVGVQRARAIAGAQLALRDACGPDAGCIEDRLVAARAAFGAASTIVPPTPLDPVVVSPLDPVSPDLGPADPLAPILLDPDRLGISPAAPAAQAPDPFAPSLPPGSYPVGPDGVLILPAVTAPPSGFVGDLGPEERLLYGPPVEVPGTAQRLRPPPPLEGAFKDLPEDRRIAVQVRLALAGLGGAPDGVWGPMTEGALREVAAEAQSLGRSVTLTTPEGVAAFLAYIESPDFEADILGG